MYFNKDALLNITVNIIHFVLPTSMYSVTCLVATWISTYSWFVSTLYLVPSSCTLCQPVLIVSTSDKKYRFGMPFKVLTKQVCLYDMLTVCTYNMYGCIKDMLLYFDNYFIYRGSFSYILNISPNFLNCGFSLVC